MRTASQRCHGGFFPCVGRAVVWDMRYFVTMTERENPIVVLGVTGCIAAYKACELARMLMRAGCSVKVVMTENATKFVGATTFRALTGQSVAVSLWEEPEARVHHVSLAEEADVFAIVPATANVVAKLAHGRADDLLTTTALATEAPLVIAPAMNVHMWREAVTVDNMAALRARGAVVIEPESGELACGDVGDGRTGYAIAQEAARRGATVTLVSGPTTLADPFGVATVRVTSALEMKDAADTAYPAVDVVVATAAVSDFRPAAPSPAKVKKTDAPRTLELLSNPDILAELGEHRDGRLLIGFAAETDEAVARATEKLTEKNLDAIVANDVSDPAIGFASAANRVWVVTADAVEELPLQLKTTLARSLWDRFSAQAREAAARRAKGDKR